MLLQHKQHLGQKTISKPCVFDDEKDSSREPSLYVELEDII